MSLQRETRLCCHSIMKTHARQQGHFHPPSSFLSLFFSSISLTRTYGTQMLRPLFLSSSTRAQISSAGFAIAAFAVLRFEGLQQVWQQQLSTSIGNITKTNAAVTAAEQVAVPLFTADRVFVIGKCVVGLAYIVFFSDVHGVGSRRVSNTFCTTMHITLWRYLLY